MAIHAICSALLAQYFEAHGESPDAYKTCGMRLPDDYWDAECVNDSDDVTDDDEQAYMDGDDD